MIVSFVFYVISINVTQNYALQVNNGVLQSASETISLRLQEVDNIANEIINNRAVRYFQANSHAFSKAFKKFEGVTASEFLQSVRDQKE